MFEVTTEIVIGQILFEKKSGEELYKVAYTLRDEYLKSNKKDIVKGLMALEVSLAAYYEGYTLGAAIASLCLRDGLIYKGSDTSMRTLSEFYAEVGADASSLCAYYLGWDYDTGYPPYVVKNPYVAGLWFKKAADAGLPDAQFEIANRYYNGNGVEINYQLAETYWLAAAEKGHKGAQYNLGLLYDGSLSEGDFAQEQAGYWLEQAARAGDKEATAFLNQHYRFNQRKNKWQKVN